MTTTTSAALTTTTTVGSTHQTIQDLEPLRKMIVAPRASVFGSGKEGEAGHPRMVDGA